VDITVAEPPASAARPVIFVHGYCGDSSTWTNMLAALVRTDPERFRPVGSLDQRLSLYYDGVGVRLAAMTAEGPVPFSNTTSQISSKTRAFLIDFLDPVTPSFSKVNVANLWIPYKAYELLKVVEEIQRITGQSEVILVGHSMGGLV